MTFHKITDTHILENGGTIRGLFKPIAMGRIMENLNWKVQWGFVFKKTIPFFWYPAHTITFFASKRIPSTICSSIRSSSWSNSIIC